MSLHRRAAKVDTIQADIVADLRKAGVRVEIIGKPVDLLCRYWDTKYGHFCWLPMEVKTPRGKKEPKARIDPRQEAQRRFLRETGVPVVTNSSEALRALGMGG